MLSLGKESTVVVAGKPWTLGRLEIGVIENFRDWIKAQEGDPFEGLDVLVKLLPPPDGIALVKEARDIRDQLKCFTLQSPLAKKWLATERGNATLILFLLYRHHAKATIEDAFALVVAMGEELQQTLADAAGELPGGPAPNP